MFLTKDQLLYNKLHSFFYNSDNINILLDVLKSKKNNKNKISLRLINWFIIYYCKNNDIYVPNTHKLIYIEYKAELFQVHKISFDPFCRHNRINFIYNDKGESIITTIGQLNFFKWFVQNNIMVYIKQHYEQLLEDMNNYFNVRNINKMQKKYLKGC